MSLFMAQIKDVRRREKGRKERKRKRKREVPARRWKGKAIKPGRQKGITEFPYGQKTYKRPKKSRRQ